MTGDTLQRLDDHKRIEVFLTSSLLEAIFAVFTLIFFSVIEEGYRNHWYWMEYFLQEYGNGYWCMVVDIDELFYFPFSERLSLRNLTSYLDHNNYTAIRSVLIDIYSDKPIINTIYRQDENPLDLCCYFDNSFSTAEIPFLDKKKWKQFYKTCYFGGVRNRVFGHGDDFNFCLTKYPLFKYSADTYLVQGMHSINGAETADIEGALLHTKYFHDFVEKAGVESIRGEHFRGGFEYKLYNNRIGNDRDLVLKCERSVKFKDSAQLIELGIMKTSERYEKFIDYLQKAFQ